LENPTRGARGKLPGMLAPYQPIQSIAQALAAIKKS
jgi:hypothetical protein